jgi:hypothetical protein
VGEKPGIEILKIAYPKDQKGQARKDPYAARKPVRALGCYDAGGGTNGAKEKFQTVCKVGSSELW